MIPPHFKSAKENPPSCREVRFQTHFITRALLNDLNNTHFMTTLSFTTFCIRDDQLILMKLQRVSKASSKLHFDSSRLHPHFHLCKILSFCVFFDYNIRFQASKSVSDFSMSRSHPSGHKLTFQRFMVCRSVS